MVSGTLALKNGYYYAVLSYQDAAGKRHQKWVSTGLPQKGNKRRAEQELIRIRSEFEIPRVAGELSSNMLFADYLDQWLEVVRARIKPATFGSYQGMVKSTIGPYDKHKEAFRNRSTTYWNLMKKEKEQTKKNEYYQLMIDDLKKALELDPDDKMVRQLLVQRLSSNVNVDAMLANIDERIGDLELEEKHPYESFKQYSEAIGYHLEAESAEGNESYSPDIKRLIEKIYKIADEKLFSQIDNDDEQMITFFNTFHRVAIKFYSAEDKGSAEKSFLIMYQFSGTRKCAALNLAYMKRRHETELTTQSVKELLAECTDLTDGLWCVNTALCYIYGVDGYEIDWNEALSVLNSAEDTQDAILWWSDIETVGREENNLVMILFHLSDKFNIEDEIEIEERINRAAADGFNIPPNLI